MTELVTLERTDPVVVLSAEAATESHAAAGARCIHRETGEPIFVHRAASEIAEDGTTIRRVRLFAPTWNRYAYEHAFRTEPWDGADDTAFRTAWANAAAAAPRERIARFWMVTGLLLPIWKHLPRDEQRIWRAMTDDGAAVLGRVLSESDAGALRALLAPSQVKMPPAC